MNLIKELTPGTAVSVSYKNHAHKNVNTSMTYVGLIINEYLILKFQSSQSAVSAAPDLQSGVPVLVRAVLTQEILTAITFSVTSLGISKLREPLLLVEYPKTVTGQHLRSAPRIPVELMATIQFTDLDTKFLALITDFSMTGLKCECALNEDGNNPEQNEVQEQKVQVEFSANDDLDIELNITGTIKNARIKEKMYLGIAFNDEDLAEVKSAFTILIMREYGL